MIKPNIIPSEQYESHFKSLRRSRKDFTVVREGNIKEIKYDSKVYKFISKITPEQRLNMEACRNVKTDIKSRIKFIQPLEKNKPIRERVVDVSKIILGGDYKWFDISHCYWEIAYNKNIISLDTYIKYIDHKEARNIAIGSLAKPTWIIDYVKGEQVNKDRIPSKYECYNRIVKETAYAIYEEISAITSVGYYNIDEYVIPIESSRQVSSILRKYNVSINNSKLAYMKCIEYSNNKALMQNKHDQNDKRYIIG
jgi:hypothetical protein